MQLVAFITNVHDLIVDGNDTIYMFSVELLFGACNKDKNKAKVLFNVGVLPYSLKSRNNMNIPTETHQSLPPQLT